jgi:hypothetical protein
VIGIIQRVLLSLLEQEGGAALRERVMQRAGLEPDVRFRINVNYADEDMLAMLEATAAETGLSRAEIMRRYADHFIDYAAELFPRFFSLSADAREFMLRQPTIHSSFSAGLRTAEERQRVADKFHLQECDDGSLRVEYRSANRLCDLYGALAVALGRRYGETIAVETLGCGLSGGPCCLRVYWPQRHAASAHSCPCQQSAAS